MPCLAPAEAPGYVVDKAGVGRQEGVYEVAYYHPREEVRQEHERLAYLGQLLGVQLAYQYRQRYGYQHAQYYEYRVVHQCVAQHVAEVAGLEQELEVVKPHPFAVVEQAPQKALAGLGLVVFERNYNAKHGRVAEHGKPYRRRQMQQEQLQIVKRRAGGSPGALFPGRGPDLCAICHRVIQRAHPFRCVFTFVKSISCSFVPEFHFHHNTFCSFCQ